MINHFLSEVCLTKMRFFKLDFQIMTQHYQVTPKNLTLSKG